MARRTTAALMTFAMLLAMTVSTAVAGDWPGWRGPSRDDVSKETGLLQEWPTGGPKKLWVSDQAGIGYAGFAVVDGKLYTLGAIDNVEYVMAFDANTGKHLWQTPVGDRLGNNWGDGPRSSPTVSDGLVYALGGKGNLVCVSAADGKEVWKKSLTKDFGGGTPGWGYTESPLVDGNKVIATPGGKKGALVALDKKNGELIWQSKDFTEGAQYASVIAIENAGKRQYVQLTMSKLAGINAETGDVLWTSDWPGRTAVIPTPIYNDGRVYISSGYGVGCKLVRIGAGSADDVWDNKVMKNHHGGVILLNGHLFGYSDGPGWVCQKFDTGEEVWADKSLGKGAIAYADGRFYCLDEGSGTLALIDASTGGWKEHGRLKVEPQSQQRSKSGRIWTHPVIANGKLYLRDQEYIYCYDIKAK